MRSRKGSKIVSVKWKKAVAGVGIAAAIAGSGFAVVRSGAVKFFLPSYQALRVIDGDTFETTEHQVIRLANVDAPEYQYCGGPEAKEQLEKLISGKKLYVKVVYRDPFQRLVSEVFTIEGQVNENMAESGWARYLKKYDAGADAIEKAGVKARTRKSGVFLEKCTQVKNQDKPECSIKGNSLSGKMYYRYPGCGQYNNTVVQLYLGDQWFCSEKEAEAAGFEKGSDCFEARFKGI